MSETTINYASNFSDLVDERFSIGCVTETAVNKDYDFTGVNTVSVYSSEVAPLNNYIRASENNRYGTPTELGNAKQELILKQDKAFTFTIDRGNYDDTMMANSAGKALEREVMEVLTPAVDKYRLSVMAKNAGISVEIPASSLVAGAYLHYLEVSKQLTEARVPLGERIVFMTPDYYQYLLTDTHYTGTADAAAALAQNGAANYICGASIKVIPSDYLPKNTNFLITHPCATVSPIKLSEYKIHDKPQGLSGWLIEGRVFYDAFVLNNKKKAIAISKKIEETSEIITSESSTVSGT